jgi:hypothetical protein
MKRFTMVSVVCLILRALHAQEEKSLFSGSFSGSTGLFWGGVENAIQDDSEEETVYTRSFEENWVPYIQVAGQFNIYDFFLKGLVVSGIPVRAGTAKDANFPGSDNIQWRSESENDSVLKEHFQGTLGLGYALHLLGGKLSLIPQGGFTYKTRSWNAADGEALLQGKTANAAVKGVYLNSTEVTLYPSIGVELGYGINEIFEVRAGGSFFPYVLSENTLKSYFPSIENNYNRLTGMGGSAEISFLIHPPKPSSLSFILSFGYEGIYLKDGDMSVQLEGFNVPAKTEYENYSSTYDSTSLKLTLGVQVSL